MNLIYKRKRRKRQFSFFLLEFKEKSCMKNCRTVLKYHEEIFSNLKNMTILFLFVFIKVLNFCSIWHTRYINIVFKIYNYTFF